MLACVSDPRLPVGSGLLAFERHTLVILRGNQGLEGQEPVEPVDVLDPNGGDHAVSWTGRSCVRNGVVLARFDGRGGGARQDRHDCAGTAGAGEAPQRIGAGARRTGGRQDGPPGARRADRGGNEDPVVQRLGFLAVRLPYAREGAILDRCPFHPEGGCGVEKLGSYGRVEPPGARLGGSRDGPSSGKS